MPEGADFSQFAGKPVKDFTLEEGIVDPTSFGQERYVEGWWW